MCLYAPEIIGVTQFNSVKAFGQVSQLHLSAYIFLLMLLQFPQNSKVHHPPMLLVNVVPIRLPEEKKINSTDSSATIVLSASTFALPDSTHFPLIVASSRTDLGQNSSYFSPSHSPHMLHSQGIVICSQHII